MTEVVVAFRQVLGCFPLVLGCRGQGRDLIKRVSGVGDIV